MGDGMLVEFPSVVNAVACAAAIQTRHGERKSPCPQDRRIEVRIGVNLGEVIVEGDDIFGDGVNVAARLERIAEPGGIIVSASVRDRSASGSTSPSRIWATSAQEHRPAGPRLSRRLERRGAAASRGRKPLALPSKPSIAVLPFTNMSGDPEQEYFADGLVEDLITSLSKIPGLFVIARNSSFAYKGKSVDIRKVAAELGVRYVLEGSVRRAANRVRITGQLVEGTNATHVWADKFEGAVEDIFDLQDRLTESIVGAIEPSIQRAEIERARRKRPDRLDAYDLYLRALPHAYANTPADSDDALRLLGEALLLDPNYAAAHAYAAWCHQQRFFRGGFHPEDRTAALEHAHIALSNGTDDPQALSIGAFVDAMITHDYESAIGVLDRALEMNGNSALALRFSSMMHAFSERYERANEHALKALRLSPFDPMNYHAYGALAIAGLLTRRFEDAVANATLAIQSNRPLAFCKPTWWSALSLSATWIHAGRWRPAGCRPVSSAASRSKISCGWACGGPRRAQGLAAAGVEAGLRRMTHPASECLAVAGRREVSPGPPSSETGTSQHCGHVAPRGCAAAAGHYVISSAGPYWST